MLRVGGMRWLKAPHIGTISALFANVAGVEYEQMFAAVAGTIDYELERVRSACWAEMREIAVRTARDAHRVMELAREGNARGDWKAAGFASHEAWIAEGCRTGHRTAKVVAETSEALAELPHLEEGVRTGELTLEQVAAAAPNARPETDAELARTAVGKRPSEIARVARTLNPPKVADDQALYRRRKLSMKWIDGGRELVFSGQLPLEQGVIFENSIWEAAKALRAADKRNGETLAWQQYTADALVTLVRRDDANPAGRATRRSPATVVVHLSEDGTPPLLEGSGPMSFETAERQACDSRRLFIKPKDSDIVHTHMGRCSSDAQFRALIKRSGHCQYPGCTWGRELEAHHMRPAAQGGKTETGNLVLECGRHHQYIHDHGIRVNGTGANPIYTDARGRRITADRPHAPPG